MLNAIVSFLAAILAGMGVGSGGIMVVWLTAAESLGQLEARLLNLIFFSCSSVAALVINLFKKRLSAAVVIPVAAGGCVFTVGTALIAGEISSSALRISFGILMIIMSVLSAFFTIKSQKSAKNNKKYLKHTMKKERDPEEM